MTNYLVRVKTIVCFALMLMLLAACMKPKDLYKPSVVVNVSVDNLVLSSAEDSQTFYVTSNFDWSITSSDKLCVVSPSSGVKNEKKLVTVTVPRNAGEDREFLLTLTSNDVVRTVNVKQLGNNYAKTAAELVVQRFDILPDHNSGIFIPISFVENIGSTLNFNGTQSISYYKADLSNLVASWRANAVKVTVNNTIQESGVSSQNFQKEVVFRFYAKDDTYKEYKVQLTNPESTISGLPVLVLNTDDKSEVASKEVWVNGSFKFDGQDFAGATSSQGIVEIKGRGNSTWGMPKKPYALKFKEKSAGTFMGMKPHKRWVLLANYADKTSLRNRVAFELGKRTELAWTPDSRYVEVILNGRFLGNYLLTEQIKIDPNRVNIEEINNKETDEKKITGGWLMEVDRYYSNGETRYFRPSISQLPMIVKEPEDANEQQMNYIQSYFNTFEKHIFPDLPTGFPYIQNYAHLAGIPDSTVYGKYIDINSFINYWIVQELTENRDGRLPGSIYMYKGVGGKLSMGPLWDFDQTTFLGGTSWMHYDYVPKDVDYASLETRALYYNQLFKDKKFKAKVKERWMSLYGTLINEIPKFIDKEYNTIAKSLELNWIDVGEEASQGIWGLTPDEITGGGRNHDKNLRSSEAVSRLKANYIKRVNWMNNLINTW